MTAILPECAPRFATPRTPDRPTRGARIAVVSRHLGADPMPWQRQVADVVGEYDPATGIPYYRGYVVTVPRQSGKTRLILAKLTTTCLSGPLRRVVYTAQTRKDARKKFIQEQIPLLERTSAFSGMFDTNKTNGEERVIWGNGSIHGIEAVTDKAGHGGTLDEAAIDEAFAVTWAVEQAVRPAMLTVPHAQIGTFSTAGRSKWEMTPHGRPKIDEETGKKVPTYLWSRVMDGRSRAEAGIRSGLAYFEWSAPDDIDMFDSANWHLFMPALGHTQSVATIKDDFDALAAKPGEAERAYGNRWPGDSAHVQVIPAADWERCADPGSKIAGRMVWSVVVDPDRAWAAIGAAGTSAAGREHVELIAYKCQGTQWVVPTLVHLRDRNGRGDVAVGVDPASPAGSLIPDLEEAGFEVLKVPAQGRAQACGAFWDAAVSVDQVARGEAPRLVHIGQAEVTTAVESAVKRYVGEKAFVFEPGASDISPLLAVVYALWTHRAVPDNWYEIADSIL